MLTDEQIDICHRTLAWDVELERMECHAFEGYERNVVATRRIAQLIHKPLNTDMSPFGVRALIF
jgi:hypothetical protein